MTLLGEDGYAATCLDHALQLFDFADKHRGKYSDAIPNAQVSSVNEPDELDVNTAI